MGQIGRSIVLAFCDNGTMRELTLRGHGSEVGNDRATPSRERTGVLLSLMLAVLVDP